jgi:hypothetical protein
LAPNGRNWEANGTGRLIAARVLEVIRDYDFQLFRFAKARIPVPEHLS